MCTEHWRTVERFFNSLSFGERLYVELNTGNFVIRRPNGETISLPSGLPHAEHAKFAIQLAFPGLVEKHSRGAYSAKLRAGMDDTTTLPIGTRSTIDRDYARRQGGFVSLSDTFAALALTKHFIFEITLGKGEFDASTPVN